MKNVKRLALIALKNFKSNYTFEPKRKFFFDEISTGKLNAISFEFVNFGFEWRAFAISFKK